MAFHKVSLILATASMLLSGPVARSQTTPIYIGAGGSISHINDINFQVDGTIFEDTAIVTRHDGPGRLSFERGYGANIFAGYHVSRWLTIEGDVDYLSFRAKSIDENLTAELDDSEDNGGKLSSPVHQYIATANFLLSPWHVWRITPYAGAGGGLAITDFKPGSAIETEMVPSGRISFPQDDPAATELTRVKKIAPVVVGIFGIDFAATDHLHIGMRYRYFWIFNGKTNSALATFAGVGGDAHGAVLSVKTRDMVEQAITATVSWQF